MKLFSDTIHRDQWQRFLKRYPVHLYKKGEIIIMEDEVPTCARIIKSGIIKTYNINSHGEEHPVSYDSNGVTFPISWVLDATNKTEYFYEAFTHCEIFEVPKRDYLFYIKLHPKIGCEMYLTLAKRLTSLQDRIYALEQSKASEKIILTLLHLGERFALPASNKSKLTIIHLPITQQELANYIGITRETTSTELKKLERMKVIKHKNKQYEINVEKLRSLLES